MASILNRYENIMSTNVCGMIEFAEDPYENGKTFYSPHGG